MSTTSTLSTDTQNDKGQMTADALAPAPEGHAWLVIHARPRAEKQIVAFCTARGIPSYLPLHHKAHNYGNRKRTYSSPLFPGYVFCCAATAGKSLLKQNQHTANVLDVIDQTGLLAQLRQVQQAIAAGQVVEVLPYLEAGNRVRVTAGPLKGLEGVVIRAKGSTRIVINVDMIRHGVVTEVDGNCLAPA